MKAVVAVVLALLLVGCSAPVGAPSPGAPQTGAAPGYGLSSVSPSSPAPAAPSLSPSSSSSPASSSGWWRPRAGLTWQWQLTGTIDTSVRVDVFDLDAVTTPAATVAGLRAAGRRIICYVNAGAFEDFRPDASRFPAAVLGKPLDGWPGERWLDVRRWDLLEPILTARFETCRSKGFDAVEPDNVDGYANESGFPLTAADQLTFNRRLAALAHRLNLGVGLKNDLEQAAELAPAFDFAVNEECARYRECERLRVFVAAGKPVFHVEYDLAPDQFCPGVRALGFSSMRKKLDLDAWRQPC
jgi:hypothetical protein